MTPAEPGSWTLQLPGGVSQQAPVHVLVLGPGRWLPAEGSLWSRSLPSSICRYRSSISSRLSLPGGAGQGSVPPCVQLLPPLARPHWDLGLRATSALPLPGGQHRDALGACLPGSLTTLPSSLAGLARLVHLDLSFNSLETLPGCVPQMRGLGALLLSHNRLSELPEALGALPALTFLAVTHNRLRTLPTALGALSTLQRLDLSENLLDTLPPEIGGLSSLTELSLASNRLQSLPASLGECWLCPAWPTGPAGRAPRPRPGLQSHGGPAHTGLACLCALPLPGLPGALCRLA